MKLAKDIAKDIRKEIKSDKGYTNRDVKVNCSNGSIYINVMNYEVDCNYLEDLAKKHEQVDYDEITGEILSGGNTFIFVKINTINPTYKDIVNRLFEYIRFNKKDKKVKINDNLEIIALSNDNTSYIECVLIKNNQLYKTSKYRNELQLAKELTILN
ncbi:MAG: hypothetical protein E6346_05695 [Lactococcus lactis]|nr:hypothetical protein [Lactococcus lactis]